MYRMKESTGHSKTAYFFSQRKDMPQSLAKSFIEPTVHPKLYLGVFHYSLQDKPKTFCWLA